MKSLCRLFWSSVTVNFPNQTVRSCCLSTPITVSDGEIEQNGKGIFKNHPQLRSAREELVVSGTEPQDCSKCFDLERLGGHSSRLDNLFQGQEEQNEFFQAESPGDSKKTKRIDVELSRKCNAKCIYCNRYYSSLWEIEDIKRKKIPKGDFIEKNNPKFREQFWSWFESVKDDIDCINFLGGEPFIVKEYYEILEYLAKINYKTKEFKTRLDTVSNLNFNDSQLNRYESLLPKLLEKYRVNIDISMEATYERAEYIRTGVVYKRWLKNFDKLLKFSSSDFEVASQMSLNALCATDLINHLKQLAELRDRHKVFIPLRQNIVTWPAHLSPYILPASFAKHFYEAADFVERNQGDYVSSFEPYTFNTWSNYAVFLRQIASTIESNKESEKELTEFYFWVEESDLYRKEKFLDVFPDFRFLFNKSKEIALSKS